MSRDKNTPTDPQLVAWRDRLSPLQREPDAALWERIAAELPSARPRRRWRLWPLATVAAALAGLVIGLSLRSPLTDERDQSATPLAAQALKDAQGQPELSSHTLAAALPDEMASTGFSQPPACLGTSNPTPAMLKACKESCPQPVQAADLVPLHPYEKGLQLFATANYCQSHVQLNEARKHVCAREPLEQINQLMSYIESRVSSECLCLAYEEAGR